MVGSDSGKKYEIGAGEEIKTAETIKIQFNQSKINQPINLEEKEKPMLINSEQAIKEKDEEISTPVADNDDDAIDLQHQNLNNNETQSDQDSQDLSPMGGNAAQRQQLHQSGVGL